MALTTGNDIFNINSDEQLCKLAQTIYLPPKLGSVFRKTQRAKKQLPFEAIDLTMYEEETDKDYTNMVAFKTIRQRICAWVYAILKYHCLHPPKNTSGEARLISVSGASVKPESRDLSKIQIHVKENEKHSITIHIYTTNGTIAIQGRHYKKWAHDCFQDILMMVENSWKAIDKQRITLRSEIETKDTMIEVSSGKNSNVSDPIAEEPISPIIVRGEDDISSTAKNALITVNESSTVSDTGDVPVMPKTTGIATETPKTPDKTNGENDIVDGEKQRVEVSRDSSGATNDMIGATGGQAEQSENIDTNKNTARPDEKSKSEETLNKADGGNGSAESSENEETQRTETALAQLDTSVTGLIDRIDNLETENNKNKQEHSGQLNEILQLVRALHAKQMEMDDKLEKLSGASAKKKSEKALCSLSSAIAEQVSEIKTESEDTLQKVADIKVKVDDNNAQILNIKQAQSRTDGDVNIIRTTVLEMKQETNKMRADLAKVVMDTQTNPAPKINTNNGKDKPSENNSNGSDENPFITVGNGAQKVDRNLPSIKPMTKTAVISDSVLRDMTPEMVNPQCQTIALGGADTQEITNALKSATQNGNVENTFIHVGFKDSKNGPSPNAADDIKNMLIAARGAFPEAKLHLTSVLPSKTNKNRCNIDTYNSVMESVCDSNGARYVNLIPAVLAPNCKKVNTKLFADEIHLNNNGTTVIGKQIQSIITESETDSESNTEDGVNEDDDSQSVNSDELFHTLPVFEENGNGFMVHVTELHDRQQLRKTLSAINEKFPDATSNSYAYRFREGHRKISQESFDDGEYLAGKVMLNCLLDYNIKNTLVVISRWVGTHLENRRFEIYYNLTAAACGKDPANNLPWPNHHPKFQPPIPPKQPGFPSKNWIPKSPTYGSWNPSRPYTPQNSYQGYKPYGGQGGQFRQHGGYARRPRYMYTDGRRISVQI